MKYLGIDTSNYRTSAALFNAADLSWNNKGRLLDVPENAIGLRQSDALFQHTLHLNKMISQLPLLGHDKIYAIGCSTRPRAVEGSYMPCFLAGENVARSMAHILDVPFVECSHQQGHLAAAALSANALHLLSDKFLAWHLSGGTTELVLVDINDDGTLHAQRIGGTTDLAAGQLLDRAGNIMGIKFPAGAQLNIMAENAEERIKPFAPKVSESEFSLSGMQNKIENLVQKDVNHNTIALFAIETLANAVVLATKQAMSKYNLPILCAGGVMSNTIIQKQMKNKFRAYTAKPELSGDNAVGCAIIASMQNGVII